MAFRTHALNVKEFYARGDGVTDDTAHLADAGGG
jgi:hypothetical protein